MTLSAEIIKSKAKELGFDAAGLTDARFLEDSSEDLQQFLRENRHGTMDWLASSAGKRPDPTAFFPDARSVLMVAHNYYRSREKMMLPESAGTISVYARGRDYHKVLRKKLKKLLNWMISRDPELTGRIFVDSFPVMEKPLARKAGLGWIAKNTTLIIPKKGSYFFLGGILLNRAFAADTPFSAEYCGECTRCRNACPTDAITAPFQLDARRCISYLTIEHRAEIPGELQPSMGNYIFGCDICQMVCPWNQRFAADTAEPDFFSRFSEADLQLARLSSLSREEFEKMFEGTPVRRSGYENFRRNLKIARRNLKNRE